jgi:hypothetical protein
MLCPLLFPLRSVVWDRNPVPARITLDRVIITIDPHRKTT